MTNGTMYRIPFDFSKISIREETVVVSLQEKEVEISISPTPMSLKMLVSISIDGESIIHNRVREFGEPFIGRRYLFNGDLYVIQLDDRDLDFRVDELPVRGELIYVDYRGDSDEE